MPASNPIACWLTPAAQRDLEDIWLYTAQTWSMAQADRYTDIIEDTFDRLMFIPEMARERSEFDPPVCIHPSAEHLIIYRVEQDQLIILRILGAGQPWHAILRAADQ